MGASFDRWLNDLSAFQMRRWMGQSPAPWEELAALKERVDSLAAEGLDLRDAARCICELEHAALLYEARSYGEAWQIAERCQTAITVLGAPREIIESNRNLIFGNIAIIRDENYEAAAEYYRHAMDASGVHTSYVCGNAAFNRATCLTILDRYDEAESIYGIARRCYLTARRDDKIPDVLHAIGNLRRGQGRLDDAIHELRHALTAYSQCKNYMGMWRSADDLARAYLSKSHQQPEDRNQWLQHAADISTIAAAASEEVWKTQKHDVMRLSDLSDQMINFTATRCEIASYLEDSGALLGTLSLMKGRMRSVQRPIPERLAAELPADLREGIEIGVPAAIFESVAQLLPKLAPGQRIAFVDQFALKGDELHMGWTVVGPGKRILGGYVSGLPEPIDYDPSHDLRGRARACGIVDKCRELLSLLERHANRCSMVIGDDPDAVDDAGRQQLMNWANEIRPLLQFLGEIFFPKSVLEIFRDQKVEHVVLCVDPLFARIPYLALEGSLGPILDEPWSLSLVTASTELPRILDRITQRAVGPRPVQWFGPDPEVNLTRGGNRELSSLLEILPVEPHLETAATLESACAHLAEGAWVHFRGHGQWTNDVTTSGLVFSQNEILKSSEYLRCEGQPGFLFTSACFTGFGEAVGTELFGSLVDYDRAGLIGAVLTGWPIHGDAATIFTRSFYRAIIETGDVARAWKLASLQARSILPHPYLWSPFTLVGGWECQSLLLKLPGSGEK